MTTTTTTIAERVAAGAAWLDEHEPGWVDRIDLDKLDLGECDNCIVGQLAGNFDDGVHRHQLDGLTIPLGLDLNCKAEFFLCDCDFPALTEAWRELIAGRRAGAA